MGQLKVGMKLHSAVCHTQIMILRLPGEEVTFSCNGVPMEQAEVVNKVPNVNEFGEGTLTGKRYTNEEESVECLCTKGCKGTIEMNDSPLNIKQAKRLPSSD